MEKTNQNTPFVLEDIYPHVDEVGNSLWGRHVANNLTRLLDVTATVTFNDYARRITVPGIGTFIALAMGGHMWDSQVLPIAQYGFRAIPAIEWYAKVTTGPAFGSVGTVLAYGTVIPAGSMPNPLDATTATFWYDFTLDGPGNYAWLAMWDSYYRPFGKWDKWFKIEDEIFKLKNWQIGWPNPSSGGTAWLMICSERGHFQTLATNHAREEYLAILPREWILATALATAAETSWEWNPAWVDCQLYQQGLVVNWLYPYSGTVLLKIFGI